MGRNMIYLSKMVGNVSLDWLGDKRNSCDLRIKPSYSPSGVDQLSNLEFKYQGVMHKHSSWTRRMGTIFGAMLRRENSIRSMNMKHSWM